MVYLIHRLVVPPLRRSGGADAPANNPIRSEESTRRKILKCGRSP